MKIRMNPKDVEMMCAVCIPNYDGCRGRGKDAITEKQKVFLRNLGINTTGLKYKGQAMVVIDAALRREKCGLASFNQINEIRNLGIRLTVPMDRLTSVGAQRILNKYYN